MEPITTDTIITHLKSMVEQKIPVAPSMWVDAAMKLNILIGDEHDKLLDLEQQVARMKVAYLTDGDTVAKAKAKVEAEDIYKESRKQKAYIDQINEHIRIAKVQSRLKSDEMRGY